MFKATVLVVGFSALLFGCSTEPGTGTDETQEIIDNLQQVGYPTNDIQVVDDKVYVGNDAEVSLTASREMLLGGDSTDEQFRTFNLVGGGVVNICINGPQLIAVNPIFATGLALAAENFTNLFNAGLIRLRFYVFPNIPPGIICNFIINAIPLFGVAGGSAGFPAGGAPFSTIRIGTALTGFSLDVIEHVITHELGHCIGFRHSDFFNRSISCGGAPVNEENPPSGLGAVLIPGTPNGSAVGLSLMNSCFRSTENGEFTPSDVTALNNLY
jgi:Dual-action HEIGH metallo-peptidase